MGTALRTFAVSAFVLLMIFVAIAAYLAPEEGPRPEEKDARATFLAKYPDTEILDIRISEDEVIARSFEVRFRRRDTGITGKLNFQYMNLGDRRWGVSPPLPEQLP